MNYHSLIFLSVNKMTMVILLKYGNDSGHNDATALRLLLLLTLWIFQSQRLMQPDVTLQECVPLHA